MPTKGDILSDETDHIFGILNFYEIFDTFFNDF